MDLVNDYEKYISYLLMTTKLNPAGSATVRVVNIETNINIWIKLTDLSKQVHLH